MQREYKSWGQPSRLAISGSMSSRCLASMRNANPRDQCRKLITPNDDITMGACADEDLDRRKLVDVLPRVFNSCLQRDELLVRSAGEPAMNCDRSGRIHQHLLARLRRHKLNERDVYLHSTCPAISEAKSGYRSVERLIVVYARLKKENPATAGIRKGGVF